jgi:hypothetical protein
MIFFIKGVQKNYRVEFFEHFYNLYSLKKVETASSLSLHDPTKKPLDFTEGSVVEIAPFSTLFVCYCRA